MRNARSGAWLARYLVLLLPIGTLSGGQPPDGGSAAGPAPPTKIVFSATDGFAIHADYYGASGDYQEPPFVILVHDLHSDRKAWRPLIDPLRERGFAVLAVDLRGHGESSTAATRTRAEQRDPTLVQEWQQDLRGAYDWVAAHKSADRARFALVGAGVGAAAALQYAVKDRSVDAVVCFSPALKQPGLDPAGDAGQIRGRKILIMSAENDPADYRPLLTRGAGVELRAVPGSARGTNLFGKLPRLEAQIVQFLVGGVGPSSASVVYGSIESNIFHPPGSEWIARIAPTNLRYYSSAAEATERGLRAARSQGPRADGPDRKTDRGDSGARP